MSFFIKAAVEALKAVPVVNGRIDGDDFIQNNFYDIGVAVGTERGLVVPVVRDADKKSFADLERDIADYAAKARDGKLKIEELQGGTFTITNGGVYGSLFGTPILNPPQSGILGMHKIMQRPVAVDGNVAVRPMMYLALSYDHRAIDGKEAVTFLIKVKECIENPKNVAAGFLGKMQAASTSFWSKLPVSLRAIVSGLLIALVAANVWPILLVSLNVPAAAVVEMIFLGIYLWWTSGAGSPRRTRNSRRNAFRCGPLSRERWLWGLIGAISFAVTVHASIVLLFRFVPVSARGVPAWLQPFFYPDAFIEVACSDRIGNISGRLRRNRFPWLHAAPNRAAPWRSDSDFSIIGLFHLDPPQQSVVVCGNGANRFGAGLLLGLLAWSSQSLIPPIIGHALMDVGLFAYWWTGIAGYI